MRTTDYLPDDTQQDLRVSGRRLADLVEQVAAAHPGVPIDLLAHSQGGLVARLARRGVIPAITLPDGQLRFSYADMSDWIESRRRCVAEDPS